MASGHFIQQGLSHCMDHELLFTIGLAVFPCYLPALGLSAG